MNNDTNNIMPDAAGTYYAIRNSGYTNNNAIADLIDNSIDARARNIRITISDDFVDKLPQVVIADDGCGMSMSTLQDAIRLGKSGHSSENDLGKYGFGLKSASLSIARRITIVSKKDGETSTAIFDYDHIVESNTFSATFRPANEQESFAFDNYTQSSPSGTVIILSKCDRLSETDINRFVSDLKEFIRRVFRKFMQTGNHIFVNSPLELQFNDPLWLDDKKTKVYIDEDLKIPYNGESKILHVKAVTVPDQGTKNNRKAGFNIQNQGFYFMRNNREIAAGYEIAELFKKHNDYNLLRIELSFDSSLDDEMNINYTKHNAAPNRQIIDELEKCLGGTITAVRKAAKSKQTGKPATAPTTTITPGSIAGVSNTSEPVPAKTEETPKAPTGINFAIDAFSPADGSFRAFKEPTGTFVFFNLTPSTGYSTKVAKSADPKLGRALLEDLIVSLLKTCEEKGIDGIDLVNALGKTYNG